MRLGDGYLYKSVAAMTRTPSQSEKPQKIQVFAGVTLDFAGYPPKLGVIHET